MKFLDLLFYRLFYLYRKEKKREAIDSASNLFTMIILTIPLSIIFTIVRLFFTPKDGWGINLEKPFKLMIIVPVFFITSFIVKKKYLKKMKYQKAEEYADILKFDLLTIMLILIFFIFLPKLAGQTYTFLTSL